jgi:hypothetical protein
MTLEKQLQQLRFEPKNQIIAGRFTEREATIIRQFCTDNEIPLSRVIRYAFQQIIPNL